MRSAAILLALVALAAGCGGGAGDPAPNLVLLTVDTLRADRMGAYGHDRDTTPNVDAFFSDGTRFERAVSSAPCTIPAVPQLLTGRVVVDEASPTLAELVSARGYETHAIVSQHMFSAEAQPRETGARVAAQVPRGFASFDAHDPSEVDRHGFPLRSAREIVDRAVAWLEARPADRPFLLWLHFFDPHDPYEPPAEHRVFDAGTASARDGDRRTALMRERTHGRWQRAGAVFGEADVAHLRDLYDGEIRYVDAELGRLFRALREAGLVERSVVALLSDHGEWLGEGGRWDHCQTLAEEETHVPLLLLVRGGPLDGRPDVAAPVSSLDVLPTALRLLGIDADLPGLDGRDLSAAGGDARVLAGWGRQRSAYAGRWKLVVNARRGTESLVDLERAGGAAGGAPPEVRAELRAAIDAAGAWQWAAERQEDEVHEHLRRLGYLE